MVHLLHRLYGVDAPVDSQVDEGARLNRLVSVDMDFIII